MSEKITYWTGWLVTTVSCIRSTDTSPVVCEYAYDDVYYGSVSKRANIFRVCSKTELYWSITDIDPPTNTQPSTKVSDENGQQTVNSPVMSDTDMTQIMGGEGQLMPEQAKTDS